MINLPPQTSQIFSFLSKGFFLSSNSQQDQRDLFLATEKFQSELSEYFKPLGFELQSGRGFYYFTFRSNEPSSEERLEQISLFIEWLDFFRAFDPSFGSGYRFSIEQIHNSCLEHFQLKKKLNQLSLRGSQARVIDKIRQLVKLLEKQGFVEVENETKETYRVLSAFSFLEFWAKKIELV